MVTAANQTSMLDVSAEELLSRAWELLPSVEQQVTETKRLTHLAEELHGRFEESGCYRTLMPKTVWVEVARADPSAAWCVCRVHCYERIRRS